MVDEDQTDQVEEMRKSILEKLAVMEGFSVNFLLSCNELILILAYSQSVLYSAEVVLFHADVILVFSDYCHFEVLTFVRP